MKLVICGLAITSSWGNGHATTYRALCQALHARGHRIVFYEHDVEWYRSNRDLPRPEFCDVRFFAEWGSVRTEVQRELRDADVLVMGSFFPDGAAVSDELLATAVPVKVFYDIDTPVTMTRLRAEGAVDYLRADQIPAFDIYFSFTGGPLLQEIEEKFGSPAAVPLYCSFDPAQYRRWPLNRRFACDLTYMGTYAPDRQPKIDELLCEPALRLPERRFLVAGPQYPASVRWPRNVQRIMHLNPRWHAEFYSSSRMTLNVTRRDMVQAGYSPSVRLFEAAACGAAIVSDNWPGLEHFFRAGEEILLPANGAEVAAMIEHLSEAELRHIGDAAQARVLAQHTSAQRAQQFEKAVEQVLAKRSPKVAMAG